MNDVTRTYLNGFTVSLVKWADRIASDVLCGLDENGKRDSALEVCLQRIQQVFFFFRCRYQVASLLGRSTLL